MAYRSSTRLPGSPANKVFDADARHRRKTVHRRNALTHLPRARQLGAMLPLFALLAASASSSFLCEAVALHDVDGPIHCSSGLRIRLQGIGATEMDGTCRKAQPCVPGDPVAQRRIMVTRVIGAAITREDKSVSGQAWFAKPVVLHCESVGRSYDRVTAWCRKSGGEDLSCGAIRAGIALRWAQFDRANRLIRCAIAKTGTNRIAPK